MAKDGTSIIEMKNINKIFGQIIKNQVLFDVNLEINKGEFIAIIGPSGSGKSTLMNILGALDLPTSGDFFINNQNINILNENDLADFRNKTMGFIFQFHYLLPEFSALENVLIPYYINGFGNSKEKVERINRARELLVRVGLEKEQNQSINKLSGGQQQRVAIARALINSPQIILADEPTGSLDTKTSDQVLDLLREINTENKTTFLVVTHDRSIATKADRIIELVDGRIHKNYLPSQLGATQTWKNLEQHACYDCDTCS